MSREWGASVSRSRWVSGRAGRGGGASRGVSRHSGGARARVIRHRGPSGSRGVSRSRRVSRSRWVSGGVSGHGEWMQRGEQEQGGGIFSVIFSIL